jgi:hypothetical protein
MCGNKRKYDSKRAKAAVNKEVVKQESISRKRLKKFNRLPVNNAKADVTPFDD